MVAGIVIPDMSFSYIYRDGRGVATPLSELLSFVGNP